MLGERKYLKSCSRTNIRGRGLLNKAEPRGMDSIDFIGDRLNRLTLRAVEEKKISISRAAEIPGSKAMVKRHAYNRPKKALWAHRKTHLTMLALARKTLHNGGFSYVAMSNLRFLGALV